MILLANFNLPQPPRWKRTDTNGNTRTSAASYMINGAHDRSNWRGHACAASDVARYATVYFCHSTCSRDRELRVTPTTGCTLKI